MNSSHKNKLVALGIVLVLFFLLMEENGVASDEGGGDEHFACVALEGGILYSGLGVEYLAT